MHYGHVVGKNPQYRFADFVDQLPVFNSLWLKFPCSRLAPALLAHPARLHRRSTVIAGLTARLRACYAQARVPPTRTRMTDYGFLSIVPPLLTIAVALYSRNVLVALMVGIASGSFIIADFDPFNMMLNAIEEQVLAEERFSVSQPLFNPLSDASQTDLKPRPFLRRGSRSCTRQR